MLQSQSYQEPVADQNVGEMLSPARFYEIAKRRALYFIIPFLLVLAIGSLVTLAWPAKYLSEGKILISSQEIPRDLVRPTVVSLANERIQVIGQRILTRENLLAIAKKYQILNNTWQGRFLSGTEIVDFIRDRTQIKAMDLKLPSERKQAIAFSVGFEYEQPQIAMRVANELVTMILSEDVRARTAFAAETTKFLERELQRLEAQLGQLDTQIADVRTRLAGSRVDPSVLGDGKSLAALKSELVMQSAVYSETHPNIRALKRRIAALEKLGPASASSSDEGSKEGENPSAPDAATIGALREIDSLETKRKSVREELSNTTQKLAAARLGESLERGQHSERLEVLEQPTLPTKPVSPNRGKLFLFVCVAALMAGGGLAFGTEMLDQSVRRSSDLFSMIDSHLVVSIPYITTTAEVRRKKIKLIVVSVAIAAIIVAAVVAILFILPPLDILFDKAMKILVR